MYTVNIVSSVHSDCHLWWIKRLYNKARHELFIKIESYWKQNVGLELPQSYNPVVNWNTFSIYHNSFCSFPWLYKVFIFNFLRKKKKLPLCCYLQTAYSRGLGGVVYKNEKEVMSVYKNIFYFWKIDSHCHTLT